MQKLIDWVKSNKLASLLLLIVTYFFWQSSFGVGLSRQAFAPSFEAGTRGNADMMYKTSPNIGLSLPQKNYAPAQTQNRLLVQESNLSLLVKNVSDTQEKIIDFSKSVGGFMVSSSLSNPQDVASGNVTVRVPEDRLKEVLAYFRSLSVKVVSENLTGTDVTDEYVDIEARLSTLNRTKAKFEEIMDKATQVQDILSVQREIISLQDQIDSLKGRKEYLTKTAELAKITIYLSTDELALPYSPGEPFRPDVIFKLAVRSLIGTLQGIAESAIWIVVYSVIWVPVLLGVFLYRRLKSQKTKPLNP